MKYENQKIQNAILFIGTVKFFIDAMHLRKGEKLSSLSKSMLTRKRARDNTLKQFVFHPIMESASLFLEFKDCGQVASISRVYAEKMWLYVLRSMTRASGLNTLILWSSWSQQWFQKYRFELKHQKIEVHSNHAWFFKLNIPQCDTLVIVKCFQNSEMVLPKVRCLTIERCHYSVVPKMQHIREITYIALPSGVPWSRFPESLEVVRINNHTFNVSQIDDLPNLHRIELSGCEYTHYIDILHELCPALKTLVLNRDWRGSFSELKGLKVETLIIDSKWSLNIASLTDVDVQTLMLRSWPKISDEERSQLLTYVRHVVEI
jgi:hypothetical protein